MFDIWFIYTKKVIIRLAILIKAFPRHIGYIFIHMSLPGSGGLHSTPTLKPNSVLFSRQYKQ